MFTGIVQHVGRVRSFAEGVLVVDRVGWPADIAQGDSVCVSGVCLTATRIDGDTLAFDVVPETLEKTTLGSLAENGAVNLEIAVTPSQPMGGHFMQGHVDGVGHVESVDQTDGQWRTTLRPPAELIDYLIPKGSVAIDGVSLTIASVQGETFDVALIPTTLRDTTLDQATVGRTVNLETDVLSKTVVHWLRRQHAAKADAPLITMQSLHDAGFETPDVRVP